MPNASPGAAMIWCLSPGGRAFGTVAESLRAETGVSVEALPADLTDPADLASVEERLREDPRIGVLVNNAGAIVRGGFAARTPMLRKG